MYPNLSVGPLPNLQLGPLLQCGPPEKIKNDNQLNVFQALHFQYELQYKLIFLNKYKGI